MNRNRRLFLAGFNPDVALKVHCVSRVVDRNFVLGDEEREMFVALMRRYELFCGVNVLAYCVMSNHFHILLEVPPQNEVIEMEDEQFLKHLRLIYSEDYARSVEQHLKRLNKNQAPKARREYMEKYTRRMGNMSEFMKALKQGFSRWFNKQHGRRGTLWEDRYSSTAVSAGSAARMVAAYIDLNPVRAGMVDDPMRYRWCSYAEAVAGDDHAVNGYEILYAEDDTSEVISSNERAKSILTIDRGDNAHVLKKYRILLAEEGEQSDGNSPPIRGERKSKSHKRRNGYSREEIDTIIKNNGKLSRAEILRCKTRYFTDGAVIGSRSFVNGFFKRMQEKLRTKDDNTQKERKKRASLMHSTGGMKTGEKLYSYRNLQKDVYGS